MSDTVDTDIEANAILNSYMYRVLQKTLPRRSWEEWGLSTQDALDAGFNAAPTRTWLWNRTNSGSCAVNADAVVMVAGLTRLALEGKIAKKFNPQNTAEKVLIFFTTNLAAIYPPSTIAYSNRTTDTILQHAFPPAWSLSSRL